MEVRDLRQDYRAGEMRRQDLAPDPFAQFGQWLQAALACEEIKEANAMALSTADRTGRVTSRTVLLKGWNADGFSFFTNYASPKAQAIGENSQVALLFAWLPLERQVCISGRAEKTSREESQLYFSSRPLLSRIGAWASRQGSVLPSREILEKSFEEYTSRFADGEIPLPEFWGGYRVVPESIEFWQGRRSRLHDRFLYTRESGNSWHIDRLAP